MSPYDNRGLDSTRRKFLKGSAIPAAALVAGCTGGSGGDGSGGDGSGGDGSGGDGSSGDGSGGDGSGGSQSTPSLVERAQEDGEVNIVYAMDDGQKLYNRIENEYGVSVSYQFKDMGKLTTQLVQEFQANQQTVDYSGATSAGQQNVLKMNEQGILRPVPEHMFDEFQLTPALGGNVGILGYAVGLTVLYNQNQVSNPPTTLDELFSEQWKGNLTVDIRDSEFVPAAREVIGDGWEEFIKNLGEYGVPFESHLGAGEAVARGEYDLSVTYLRYTQYDFGKGILKEASIENFPRTGGQTYGFLTSGAPHPDAGELALRFAAEEARQIKHLHETVGENFYYSVEAWEEEQPNLWAFTFEDAQNMDIEEIDQTWEELCLSRLQG